MNTSTDVTLFMVPALLFFYEKMVHIPPVHGLMLGSLQYSAVNLVGTLLVQAAPHSMPVSASLKISFKLSVAGLLKHGRSTSETTPLFALSSS